MKTVDEWSKAFDLLWNNIASGKAPGLEEYEKSVILTEAMNALVKDYLFSNSNPLKEGIDDSSRRQSDFSRLIVTESLNRIPASDHSEMFHSDRRELHFMYPSDILVILNEKVSVSNKCCHRNLVVLPISSEEYTRLMSAPYKFPPKGIVWRLISNLGADESTTYPVLELIGKFPCGSDIDYRIRYVKKPSPIILVDLPEGLSICGETKARTCELPEHLHDEILQRAVQIAKISWLDEK